MFRTLLAPLLALLLGVPSVSAEIYRSVDKDGNVTFSDRKPRLGEQAEQVEVGPILTIPATPVPPRATAGNSSKRDKSASNSYHSVSITSPSAEQSFHNPESLEVSVSATPGLKAGHRFRLLMGDKSVAESSSASFTVKYPDRGAQQLKVQIIDKDDTVLVSSEPLTIYIHRTIVRPKKAKSS